MKINFEERLLIFTDEELSIHVNLESADNNELIARLFSVMAYPNEAEKQHLYRLGLLATNLKEHSSKDGKEQFLLNSKELLLKLFENKTEGLKVYNDAVRSRQKGYTGAQFVRGCIAGDILTSLILRGGSLEQAYINCLGCCKHLETPISPSIPTLKKIWQEYRGISPLWAAYNICIGSPHIVQMTIEKSNSNNSVHLPGLLQIASYFRNQLLEAKISSTQLPIIKDTLEVWNFLNSNKHPIPPAKRPFNK